MDFTKLKESQPVVTKLLKSEFDQNRLVHLYMFSGPRGSLKMDAAVYFASLVLCDDGGNCGKCAECTALSQSQNPHFFILSAIDDKIKKEQISDLEKEFAYSDEHVRVFIIQDIEKTTLTAANNLLKFFEELRPNVYGILTTSNLEAVMPTIKSRAQVVKFLPISPNIISDALIKKGIDEEKAQVIAQISSNISDAINNAQNEDIIKMIEIVKKINVAIENGSNGHLEYEKESLFIKSLDKDKKKLLLELVVIMQRDKINYMLNRKNHICFLQTLEFSNIRLSGKEELDIMNVLLKFKQRLNSYANTDMVFTQMFVEIGKVME